MHISNTPVSDTQAEPLPSISFRPMRHRLILLTVICLLAIAAFLTVEVNGEWAFALPRRAVKVAGMAIVGTAIGYSTVIFQTLTINRILTPSIMGFDVLFVLLQTMLVFFVGSIRLNLVDPRLVFLLETTVMVGFALILFRWIFAGLRHGLYTLVLVGIVFGTFFGSLASLMFRVLDPNEFDSLQERLFASVNSLDETLLVVAAVVVALTIVYARRFLAVLDVLALGKEKAIALGVEYQKVVNRLLVIVAVLVAVSTALVGPVAFLGLLAANLAYEVLATHRHRALVVGAALIGVITLLGGQVILEHVFGFNATLGVLISIIGGTYFIFLLLKEANTT